MERRAKAVPRSNGAFIQAEVGIGDNQFRIHIQLGADTVTVRTGSERVIERKQPRFNFLNRKAGNRTGEFGGENRPLAAVGFFDINDAVAEF